MSNPLRLRLEENFEKSFQELSAHIEYLKAMRSRIDDTTDNVLLEANSAMRTCLAALKNLAEKESGVY